MRLIMAILFASVLSISLPHQSKAMSQEAQDRIKLLVDTINSAAQAVATHGDSVRGASGNLITILRGSDEAICAGWNIHYIRLVEAIERARVYADAQQQWKFDRAQQNLRRIQNIIERSCDQISNPDAYKDADASDPESPPKANPPTADCDAACQRRRTAYFEAQLNQSEVRTQCSRIRGQMARLDELGKRISVYQMYLSASRRARDLAKAQLDRGQNKYDPKYIVAYEQSTANVHNWERQIGKFEAQLSNMPNKATLRSRLADCEQRQREANRQKRNALDNLLAYMVAKRDPNNLSGTWKNGDTEFDCVHTLESHQFVCRIVKIASRFTAQGWRVGMVEYDLTIRGDRVSGKEGIAYKMDMQKKCPRYRGVRMLPVRNGKLDKEHLTISGWQWLDETLTAPECKITAHKWINDSPLVKEQSH